MSAHPTQLFSLLLAQNRITELHAVLTKTEPRMRSAGEQGMWAFWKASAHLASKEIDLAKALLPQIDDRSLASALELAILKAEAEKSGDFQALIEVLKQRDAQTGDALYLWERCEVYHAQSDWRAIANHALELVSRVGTSAALRLALIGGERTGNFRLCIQLLEQNATLFPNGKLPADLRRLLVRSRLFEGMPAQAMGEAEALAREFGETSDLLSIVGLRLASADPQGAAITSRELLARPDVSPTQHLHLANILHAQDASAAQAHLDKAMSGEEHSPEFVSNALSLAFRFDREDIQRRLMPDFLAAAEQHGGSGGPVRRLTLEDTLAFFKESAEVRSQVEQLYLKGQVPLHVAIERLGVGPSSQFYTDRFHPQDSSADRPSGPPIYVRHGGRETLEERRDIQRIYLDISSLLLSDELGVLDMVVDLFAPVWLPPTSVPFLAKQIEGTLHHQPGRLGEIKHVYALFESKALKPAPEPVGEAFQPGPGQPSPAWKELLGEALRTGGFLVDFLPVTAGIPPTPVALTTEEAGSVVGCASVFEALVQAGDLTLEQRRHASAHLASYLQSEQVRALPANTALYLQGEIALTLAGADILTAACKRFRVFIEPREQRNIAHTLIHAARVDQRGERLRVLQGRVRTWLEQGKIKLLPLRPVEAAEEANLEMQCVFELIGAPNVPGSWVWIDERFFNAHASCGEEVPIITLADILGELRQRGALSETDYFVKFHEMRAANLQYIPLSEDGIMHCVRSANIQNGTLIESPELATLRRYFAVCLSERGRLQFAPQPPGSSRPAGEMLFLMDSFNAIREAVIETWKDVTDDAGAARAAAQADWIIENLWVEYTVMPWLMQQDDQADAAARVAGSAVALFHFQGIRLAGDKRWKNPGLSPRERYFNWLEGSFSSELQTRSAVGRQLSEMFAQDGKNLPFAERERQVMNLVLGELLLSLPSELRAEIHLAKTDWERLGVRRHMSFNAGPWKFDGQKFCRSADRALRGISANVTAADGSKSFKLEHATEADRFLLLLSAGVDDERFAIDDPIFSVLVRNQAKRRSFLRSYPDWFDCQQSVFERTTERIATLSNDSERIRQVHQWRQGSAAFFYTSLQAQLNNGEDVLLNALEPPSVRGLLNHLRLSGPLTESEMPTALTAAASSLLAEEGFEETFRRLSALPLPLPDEVARAYAALPLESRQKWREQADREFTVPVARLHFISVVIRSEPEELGSMLTKLEELATPERELVTKAFRAVLAWTLKHFQTRADTTKSSPTELLVTAWLHATRIYHLLAPDSSAQILKEFFDSVSRHHPSDLFRVDRALREDVASPVQIYHRPLMIHGISTLLATISLDEASRERLSKLVRDFCFTRAKDETVTQDAHLLYDPRLRPNRAGSFLGVDFGAALAPLLGLETAEAFSGDRLNEAAVASMEALRSQCDQPAHWALLQCVLGNACPPEAGRNKLRDLLLECSFVALWGMEPLMWRNAMVFILQQVANFPERAVLERIEGQLVALVKTMSQRYKESGTLREDAQLLLECVRFLACVQPTESSAVREFARIVEVLAALGPALADEWWSLIRIFFTRIPAWYAVDFWPTILGLRGKSQRIG